MSTKRDTRYAAKRRAAARKRNREIGRYLFAYAVIAILIIGTLSTVFIAQITSTGTTSGPTPTPTINGALAQLVTQADQAVASGVYTEAVGLYNAYLQQNPQDADVNFKMGKALVDPKNPAPDYVAGLDFLQRALNILKQNNTDASWSAEATALISQYEPTALVTVAAIQTATAVVSGTTAVTGTVTVTITGTHPPALATGTSVLTPTVGIQVTP